MVCICLIPIGVAVPVLCDDDLGFVQLRASLI